MRVLLSILSLFHNEFNKFNNTRARTLDSNYHMTNTLKTHFWRKNVIYIIVGNPNRKKMHIFGFVGIFESMLDHF